MKDQTPVDLLAVALLTLLAVAGIVSTGLLGRLQAGVGFVFIFFAPGYALISALVPHDGDSIGEYETEHATISFVERLLIAVGLSIVIVPAIGLLLNYSSWGLDPVRLLSTIGLVTVVLLVTAGFRRLQLPPDHRFAVPIQSSLERLHTWLRSGDTRWDTTLNVLLVVGLLFVTVGIGTAIVSPSEGEQYTEFFVDAETQTPNVADGDTLSTELSVENGSAFVIGITNREYETEQYTVVIELQRLERGGSEPTVVEKEEVQRFSQTLTHGETWEETTTIDSTMTGEELRVAFLLYTETPPENPSASNSYRSLYTWVDVPDTN